MIPHYNPRRPVQKRKIIGTIIGMLVLVAAAGGGVFAVVYLNSQKNSNTTTGRAEVNKQNGQERTPVITGSDDTGGRKIRPTVSGGESSDGGSRVPLITGSESGPEQPDNTNTNPGQESSPDSQPSDSSAGPSTAPPAEPAKLTFSPDLKLTADEDGNACLSGSVTSGEPEILRMAHVRVKFRDGEGSIYRRDAEGLSEELEFTLAVLPPGKAVPFAAVFPSVSTEGFALDKTTFQVLNIVRADARSQPVNVSEMNLVGGEGGAPDAVKCKVTNPGKVGLMNVMVCVELRDGKGRPAGRAYGLVNDGAIIGAGQTHLASVKVNEPVIAPRLQFDGRGYGLPTGD